MSRQTHLFDSRQDVVNRHKSYFVNWLLFAQRSACGSIAQWHLAIITLQGLIFRQLGMPYKCIVEVDTRHSRT